jgi:hypothetical protein
MNLNGKSIPFFRVVQAEKDNSPPPGANRFSKRMVFLEWVDYIKKSNQIELLAE